VVGSLLVSPFEHVNDLILLVLAAALLTGWRLAPAGIFLALATLGLFVFAGAPTTTLRWGGILWGNLVVVVEALWLLGIYASAHATGPVRALRCLLPRTAPEPAAERSVALGAPSFG
jgi:hypothetical protein